MRVMGMGIEMGGNQSEWIKRRMRKEKDDNETKQRCKTLFLFIIIPLSLSFLSCRLCSILLQPGSSFDLVNVIASTTGLFIGTPFAPGTFTFITATCGLGPNILIINGKGFVNFGSESRFIFDSVFSLHG